MNEKNNEDTIGAIAKAKHYIAKIEGHGSLEIDWENDGVKLHVDEGERLFEGILVGRTVEEMHWITPRICGVCPIAHNLASLRATESALGIEVGKTTDRLRRIMQIGQNVQSHILHAVFLALPDYVGIDRITELNKKDPEKFGIALSLKELGDEIAAVVAGRNVHPTKTKIGGFHTLPTPGEIEILLEKIKEYIPLAEGLAAFFAELEYPNIKVDLELLAQKDDVVMSNKNDGFKIVDYKNNIEEEVKDYSTAKFGTYGGGSYMAGSLARLYHGSFYEKNFSKYGIDFKNPFHNNLAQVVEVLFELEDAVDVIEELLDGGFNDTSANVSEKPPLCGVGAVEAPRGGLYNEVTIEPVSGNTAKGPTGYMVVEANIITPTVQNLTSMERSSEALLKQHSGKPREEMTRLIKMLIRAYDPCITCSVH